MAIKAAEYRRRAEEAEKAAAATNDPEVRRIYTDIAASYRELAELRERNAGRNH